MDIEAQAAIEVDAPPWIVWEVLADPEHWPEWTASINKVTLLDARFGQGASVRVVQPRMRPAVWSVNDYRPGVGFTWVARAPGVETTGEHVLTPLPAGRTRLTLTLRQRGILARVVDRVFGARTRRYVAMEAAGIRRAAEQRVVAGRTGRGG